VAKILRIMPLKSARKFQKDSNNFTICHSKINLNKNNKFLME
jgi:hypothetical protein